MNKFAIAAAVLAALPLSTPVHAMDYFLKIDSIQGDSSDSKHKNEIDVLSWSWGVSNAGSSSSGGAGVGRPLFAPFTWEQGLDQSFVALFLGVANGTHFKDALLSVRRPGKDQQEFFKMTFQDVQIVSLKSQGVADAIQVDAALTYDVIKMAYRPQKSDGSLGTEIKGEWSLKQNKASFSGDPNVMMGLAEAGGALAFVSQVPEPATWATLAAGLVVIGGLARRRRLTPQELARDDG